MDLTDARVVSISVKYENGAELHAEGSKADEIWSTLINAQVAFHVRTGTQYTGPVLTCKEPPKPPLVTCEDCSWLAAIPTDHDARAVCDWWFKGHNWPAGPFALFTNPRPSQGADDCPCFWKKGLNAETNEKRTD